MALVVPDYGAAPGEPSAPPPSTPGEPSGPPPAAALPEQPQSTFESEFDNIDSIQVKAKVRVCGMSTSITRLFWLVAACVAGVVVVVTAAAGMRLHLAAIA